MTSRRDNGRNIIITGESGLLGSTLRLTLRKLSRVIPFQRDITNFKIGEFQKYQHKIDYIIHAAAITKVQQCENNRRLCYEVNVLGTKKIVELARYLSAKLIFISTASVFSGQVGGYIESDRPRPKSYYDKSKRQGEMAVLKYKKGSVLRLNLIGIHPRGSRGLNFLEWLYDSVRSDKDMTLYNDVIVNPLSSWTIAAIIKKIINQNIKFKILHLGSSNCLSKAQIGKIVIHNFSDYRGKVKMESIDENSPVARPKQMWLDIKSAERILKIKMPKLEKEIKKILTYAQH